jgi:DNA-binding IclR family transcriptional regulator
MKSRQRSGTQTVERATRLLKEVALRSEVGWRLLDLSAQCGFDRGTTHRLLSCLVRERLVRQHPVNRRYFPGPLLFELGQSLPAHARLVSACGPALNRVAKRLGGTALFYLRSGEDFVCVARADTAPIKALTIDVGTRRPLAVSVGGVAILIALPREAARALIAQNMKRIARFGEVRIRSLKKVIRQSQKRGYGVSQGEIVPGVSAYGVAVRDEAGGPFGSISVVGSTETFPQARVPGVVQALEEEGRWISRQAIRILGKEGPQRPASKNREG